MKGSRNGYQLLNIVGSLVVLAILVALAWGAIALGRGAEASKPRLEGETAPLRQILRFPAKNFPSIPNVERAQLEKLIPMDPPIWIADVRPWTAELHDPLLGAADAHANSALASAQQILAVIDDHRRNPDETDTQFDERREIANAKERLAAAEDNARAAGWLVSYNRGVVYRLQGNQKKAAADFEQAFRRLTPSLSAIASDEAISAAIHTLYAWGGSLIQTPEGGTPHVPPAAVDRLRQSVLWTVTLIRKSRPQGVSHAAEFIDLRPTGLSSSAIRNDLVASYLAAPDYTYRTDLTLKGSKSQKECTDPFTLQLCEQTVFRGPCKYRDDTFCKTRQKASNVLSEVYETELARYASGATKEGTLWALQNIAELESENELGDQPELSYNIAHLLLQLKQPKLAYDFLAPVTQNGDQNRITESMERLCFVSSILSGAEPTAISSSTKKQTTTPSEYRVAYAKLYPEKVLPPPFEPLTLDDEQKAKALDAWLFIRRYRHLLEQGELETFIREHDRAMDTDIPKDFLRDWKQAVVVEFLQRVAVARKQASPETRDVIDRFLARSDLFNTDELKRAGLSRPFSIWKLRWVYWVFAVPLALAVILAFLWLRAAYRSTFVSEYQRQRRASEHDQRSVAGSR